VLWTLTLASAIAGQLVDSHAGIGNTSGAGAGGKSSVMPARLHPAALGAFESENRNVSMCSADSDTYRRIFRGNRERLRTTESLDDRLFASCSSSGAINHIPDIGSTQHR
jgi:hypothetical protein